MSREGKEYLTELIESVICIPDVFRIKCGNGKYLFSVNSTDQDTMNYFAVSAFYDTVCSVDASIKFAFGEAISVDLPVSLKDYDPFFKPTEDEKIALYHTENIVFRVSILWDLLAQLCNVIYNTGIKSEEIHYKRYFSNHSKGNQSFEIAKEINDYLNEKEDTDVDTNPWPGNHAFLVDYRNQMTHRVSPNISSITMFGTTLRPPILYVLHRTIEDYYQVSSYLCRLINQYLEEHKDWLPIGLTASDESK